MENENQTRGVEVVFPHLQMIRNMLRVNVRCAVTSGAATWKGPAAFSPSAEEVSDEKRGGAGDGVCVWGGQWRR